MRRNVLLTTLVILAGTMGCQSSGAPKLPGLSWWKKTPPADATASTTPAGPQLPSAGASPVVTTPPMPSATGTATYPEQNVSGTTAYPPTPYPSTTTPGGYGNAGATAATAYNSPAYSASAATTGGTPPATTAGVMAAQSGPYNSVYNSQPAAPAGTPTATYPNITYPPPRSSAGSESTGTIPNTVNNSYADTSTAPPYPSAAHINTTSAASDSATLTTGDRYASQPDDRYANPAPATPSENPGDRYARDNFVPGNYQPGDTGYDAGKTGYNPPGVSPYQSPAAGNSYVTTSRRDPFYRPGGTSDYRPAVGARPTPASGSTIDRVASPPTNARAASYDAAPVGADPPAAYPVTQPTDRYGTAPAGRY